MARGIRVLALIVSVASILSLFAGTASATGAGFFANATFTHSVGDVFLVAVVPDPVVVNRVNISYTFGQHACSGSAPASFTGVVTPAGVVTPSGSFAADPLLQYGLLSNINVPCVGNMEDPDVVKVYAVFIERIAWSDSGRLENLADPAFVGLRRAQIAEETVIRPSFFTFNVRFDPTSTADLRLGVAP